MRQRATLEALAALADRGYIGRVEAAEFGNALDVLGRRANLRLAPETLAPEAA